MESFVQTITSSPPGYVVLILLLIALLAGAWYFGIPMYQENQKLKAENESLNAEVRNRLSEWEALSEKIERLLRTTDSRTDSEVMQAITNLRLYLEQAQTTSDIAVESISKAIEELIENLEHMMEVQRRRDSEYGLLFQRYDNDLRSINDKLSQLVGALYASGRQGKRGIN